MMLFTLLLQSHDFTECPAVRRGLILEHPRRTYIENVFIPVRLNSINMSDEKGNGDREIQANRHLREWNDNLALERKHHYDLTGKHKQERKLLFLKVIRVESELSVKNRQAEELQALASQQSETRLVLQKRHLQEKALYNLGSGI
ncbi:MAG TPA: hypothetical protein VK404_16780 [Spirosoma sp.]|nr:hypothetical protein [Spirosoma sp.]